MESTSSFPVYSSAIVLATFSLLNILLDLPPFIFHTRAHNVAASSLVLWILLMNLFDLTNAILWPTDAINHWFSGTGLCDVEVKLFVGAQVGQLGALICIMQELSRVLDTDNMRVGRTREEERRKKVWEVVMCWLIPGLLMLCHYVVQPTRYSIFGINGCAVMIDNSWPAIVLVQIWPVVFALVDLYYSGLVVYRLHRYRTQFSSILSASNTSKSRFLRLFLMALILSFVFLPLTLYIFYTNVNVPHIPFSWEKVHDSDAWNAIVMIPSNGNVSLDRWIRVATGIFVFAFFGMGSEAMEMYRSALRAIGLGRIFPGLEGSRRTATSSTGSNPSFSSRAKSLFKKKWSSSNTVRTNSTINTPSCVGPKLSPPVPTKTEAWYMRLFRRRYHNDDHSMQLPMWNSSTTQPGSPNSTVRSMSEGGKEPVGAASIDGIASKEFKGDDLC